MKRSSVLLLLLVILAGCSAEKRLARLLERHPLPTDTVVVVTDTIIWRDSIVYRTIPGETIYRDTIIPVEIDLPYMELKSRSSLAEAHAWVVDNQLGLFLNQFDSVFEFKLDSAIQINKDSVYVEVVREVPVEIKPNLFWKHAFLVLAGLILTLASLWFLLRRR